MFLDTYICLRSFEGVYATANWEVVHYEGEAYPSEENDGGVVHRVAINRWRGWKEEDDS